MASRKKRHHQVPRAYLERFASSGKVRVLRRDGRSFATDPVNVAVESGFYDVVDEAGEKSSEIEDFLEAVEGAAHGALEQLDRSARPPTVGSDDRRMLARCLDPWRPVLRFNVGPLFVKGPGGQLDEQPGEVVQIWVPRRAGVGKPRQDD